MEGPLVSAQPLLDVQNLTVRYAGSEGSVVAVRDVSFTLQAGQALGIVGESGSGKSSIAGAVLDLLGDAARVEGRILFEGRDLALLPPAGRRAILGRCIGSVFQDPFTALNPSIRVGPQIAETMVRHLGMRPPEAMRRAEALLAEMGINRPVEGDLRHTRTQTQRRHEATRADRGGTGVRAAVAHSRRTHDRARCDSRGADSPFTGRAARAQGDQSAFHQPQSRCGATRMRRRGGALRHARSSKWAARPMC